MATVRLWCNMRIYVESVFNGTDLLRLTIGKAKHHEYIPGPVWGRKQAREALNLLERVYGLKRETIRFTVR